MTAQTLLERAWRAYRGKDVTKTPPWGSDKANMVLDLANQKKDEWAMDSNQKWTSLFEVRDIGTIATATLTYNLDADFLYPSDFIQVEKTNGDVVDISITKPQHRLDNTESVYISGSGPKVLTFAGTIDSGLDGGTLRAPGYYLPADMTIVSSVVAVDDPNWLVYIVASELARNDPAKQDEFPNLIGMANELYKKMVNANNDIGFKQGGTIPYNIQQVGDYSDDSLIL